MIIVDKYFLKSLNTHRNKMSFCDTEIRCPSVCPVQIKNACFLMAQIGLESFFCQFQYQWLYIFFEEW